jgi:hypothetical protein
MIKSKFFRAKDLEGVPPLILHIADVTEELIGRGGRQDVRCFLWFHENPKGLRLNKTAVNVLELAYGPDSDLWSGKRVKLYFDPKVEFGGRPVGGVGVATPPGIVYQGSAAAGAWEAPPGPAAPAGAPPPPVWDGTKWVFPTPPPAQAAPAMPPPPVWDGTKWVVVDPSTGEMAPPKHVPPPTISERINAGNPPAAAEGDWGALPPRARDPNAEFDDDIPF